MKAIFVKSKLQLEIEDREMPKIVHPTDVLVKTKIGGICGSDVHIFHGTSAVAEYPRILGHEIIGTVVETGNKVRNYSIDDRVVLDPVISCGQCYQCRIGRQNVCKNLKVRSVHVDGGFQEYFVVPEKSLHKIPDNLTWEEAIMIEPLTVAEQVCSRAEIKKEDTVLIMGAGPTGLSVLKMAKLRGAACYITDIVDTRLEIACQYGADKVFNVQKQDLKTELRELTEGIGAHVVIDAVCTVQSFEQALDYVCSAGRVITLGFTPNVSAISQFSITAREIDVRGSRLHNNKFPDVINYLSSGELEVKNMITHRFPFMKVIEAFQLIDDKNVEKGKVILNF